MQNHSFYFLEETGDSSVPVVLQVDVKMKADEQINNKWVKAKTFCTAARKYFFIIR